MPKLSKPSDTAAALDRAEADHKAAMKAVAEPVAALIQDAAPKIDAAFEALPERERGARLALRNLAAALRAAGAAMERLK
jgi:hypothetical protein